MNFSGKSWLAGAAVLMAASVPAAAWDQQGGGLKPLPGGGLALKEQPGVQGNLQNLPGVRLNPQLNAGANGANCTQREVKNYRYGFGDQPGTVNECSFGNFSVSTYNSGGGGAGSYNPFPVPGPLQGGPPAGSGGFAPTQPSMFGRPLY